MINRVGWDRSQGRHRGSDYSLAQGVVHYSWRGKGRGEARNRFKGTNPEDQILKTPTHNNTPTHHRYSPIRGRLAIRNLHRRRSYEKGILRTSLKNSEVALGKAARYRMPR